ncbi:hypothetical protein MTR67_029427 [Solanum verrucosum]|uniref:Eukaryotic translation initiation factor 2 subunit beta n=1 Tax=Solanum verrucosum TaxID=315347 RepID=A0AAF0R492_SOLVR|nr:hypothetical protein MTR67_029427 [Solanum verrucosum]
MNSNSKWLQENLEEINENVGRKLKIIEDSDVDSFAEKVEMYNETRQELNNLVDKCYNHGRGELLNNIPNSGLIPSQISISNVSSRPLLSKPSSSKQPNAPERSVVSKQLKRGVSEKKFTMLSYHSDAESDDDDGKEGSDELEADLRDMIETLDDDGKDGSDYELEADLRNMIEKLDDDEKEGSDYELEVDLLDMIEKLYIQMEWDRVVSMLQHRILRPYEDDGQVKESVSSNVDKALLKETLELHGEICRRLNEIVVLEDQLLLSRLVLLLVLDIGKLGPDTAWGLLVGQFLLIIDFWVEYSTFSVRIILSFAGDRRRTVMRSPQVLREGTKKTVFVNFMDLCKTMHRQPEHVMTFLLAEMGTSGSLDGHQRLVVIKGRFAPRNPLPIYEYVICNGCKSPDTILSKENRLFFLRCKKCGSGRSVAPIKAGFVARVGRRKAGT